MPNLKITEYSLEDFINLWLNKNWKKDDTFNLYIDGPFCYRRCNFCIHWGQNANRKSEEFIKYYNEYIPYLFEKFKPIIHNRPIDSVYFGGGTANMPDVATLEKIFKLIPNLENIKDKSFEGHPALIDMEQADLFIKYKFNYVSLGIQTLDKQMIKKQNRMTYNEEKLKEIINYLQSNNINVNCDLLTFIDTGEVEDLIMFKNDLEKLMLEYMPNIITIYPEYRGFSKSFEYLEEYSNEEKEKGYKKIVELRKTIMKAVRKFADYGIIKKLTLEKEDILNNILDDIYISKLTEEQFKKIHKYSCSSWPWHPERQNALGIGGYGKRAPYSYLGRDYYFDMHNDNWKLKIMRKEI